MAYVERITKSGKVITEDRYYTSRWNWKRRKAASSLQRLLGRLFG